jgi:hypothetical protein
MSWDTELATKNADPEALPPGDVTPDELELWRNAYARAKEVGATPADARKTALAVLKNWRGQQQEGRTRSASDPKEILRKMLALPNDASAEQIKRAIPLYLNELSPAELTGLRHSLLMDPTASPRDVAAALSRLLNEPAPGAARAEEEKSMAANVDPRTTLTQLVEKRAREQKLSVRAALEQIVAERPGLLCDVVNNSGYGPFELVETVTPGAGADPREQLTKLATQLAWDEGLPMRAALARVVQEHPELAAQAAQTY